MTITTMANVRKISVSIEAELLDEAQRWLRPDETLSGLIAESLKWEIKNRNGMETIAWFEREHGAFTQEELDWAERFVNESLS